MLNYIIPQEKINFEDKDPMFDSAVDLILKTGKASTTFIQRKLNIGYARSAKILDEIEQAGVIGPSNGASPRKILINSIDEIDHTKAPVMKKVIENVPQLKWHKTSDKTNGFFINIGTNEKNNDVTVNMEKYGNLILIGSQMTSISNLTNQIILEKVQNNSPEDLKLIVIDGFVNQIDLPAGAPHLLTPQVRQWDKVESVLKWLQMEIEHRLQKQDNQDQPNILLVINGYNELIFGLDNANYALERILTRGKSINVYTVITFDYLTPDISKVIFANNGAKVVFRPTTKQMARSSGIPESIDLTSPDEAILETMFEGKKKITIQKLNPKEIYEDIFR